MIIESHYTILTRNYASFDYKPPLLFAKVFRGSISAIYASLDHTWQIYNKNEKPLRLGRTRGRLELTRSPYIKLSYLLASDTLIKRLTAVLEEERNHRLDTELVGICLGL